MVLFHPITIQFHSDDNDQNIQLRQSPFVHVVCKSSEKNMSFNSHILFDFMALNAMILKHADLWTFIPTLLLIHTDHPDVHALFNVHMGQFYVCNNIDLTLNFAEFEIFLYIYHFKFLLHHVTIMRAFMQVFPK